MKVNPKINPKAFSGSGYGKGYNNTTLNKWKILRYGNRKDQIHPRFSGFVFQSCKKMRVKNLF